MGDEEREPRTDDPEERPGDDADEDDVDAHSQPLPPPRPINGL
jgi:hypothetical protein